MIDAGEVPVRSPRSGRHPVDTWEGMLASLERDVAATERLVAQVRSGSVPDHSRPERWSPPDQLGPIGDDLIARARELVARQAAAALALTEALAEVRARQRRSVRTLRGDYPSDGPASAYVDVTA